MGGWTDFTWPLLWEALHFYSCLRVSRTIQDAFDLHATMPSHLAAGRLITSSAVWGRNPTLALAFVTLRTRRCLKLDQINRHKQIVSTVQSESAK